jgi:hypothetical protein
MWEPRRLTTVWASTACYRDSFTFFFTVHNYKKKCFKGIVIETQRHRNSDAARGYGISQQWSLRLHGCVTCLNDSMVTSNLCCPRQPLAQFTLSC